MPLRARGIGRDEKNKSGVKAPQSKYAFTDIITHSPDEVTAMRSVRPISMAAFVLGLAWFALQPWNSLEAGGGPKGGALKSKAARPMAPRVQVRKMPQVHVSPRNGSAARWFPEPQKKSNAQLAQAARALRSVHAVLNQGDHDYGGHRLAAERDVALAEKSLGAALNFQGVKAPAMALRASDPWHPEPQHKSNARLAEQLKVLKTTVKLLEKGDHDYGGNRVQAIGDLNIAIRQLQTALNYVKK
jgi:hypothetical protein